MQKSGGGRMRPDELKHYLKSMHSDQPGNSSTKTQINSPQVNLSGASHSTKQNQANAAAHTYDNYREKWDNFDVDAAVRSLEDQNLGIKSTTRNKEAQKHDDSKKSSFSISSPPVVNSKANEWKEKGNAKFKSGDYTAAIDCYTSSIKADPQNSCVAYANRAMAYLKLKDYDAAIEDCTAALRLDDNYVKAWLRRGTAQRDRGFLEEAIADFEAALRLEPGNKSAIEDRKKCIEMWMEKNNEDGLSFSTTASVPIVLAEKTTNNTTSIDEGLLKQVSTKRVISEKHQQQMQQEKDLIKEAVIQEIEIDDDNPPPLPEEKRNVTSAAETTVAPEVVATSIKLEEPKPKTSTQLSPQQQKPPILPSSSFKAPKTGIDFERSWRGFKGNVEQQAAYLRHLNAQQLPILLKQVLTPSLLVALQLTVLGPMLFSEATPHQENQESKSNTAAAILEALPKVPRFGMNVLSVSPAQKTELRAAWDKACTAYSELSTLRPAYSV